jgi:flagellar L-ring protein precursor FlgH
MQAINLPAKGSTRIKGLFALLIFVAAAWGCSSPMSRRPAASPTTPLALSSGRPLSQPEQPTDGSLWSENGGLSEMFSNPKARRIGDILTIKIVETSSATNKASTTTDRSSGISAQVNSFFNLENEIAASKSFNPFGGVSGSLSNDFEGTGATQRSGALNAYMTARVVNLLPNGNLIIEGNREVRVNAENQLITLTGIIRSRDISAENVILSTYIADARISYSGSGVLNDKQKPGWLLRVMDKVWPF